MLVSSVNIDNVFNRKVEIIIVNFDIRKMKWIREPLDYSICDVKIEIQALKAQLNKKG